MAERGSLKGASNKKRGTYEDVDELRKDLGGEEETVRLNVDIPKSVHQQFKAQVALSDYDSMSEVVRDLVTEWVSENSNE